jgi:hypothetical protein
MHRLYKAAKKTVAGLILTFTIFSGIFQNFTSLFSWGDGFCQTLDEDDPPQKNPIEPYI